MKWHWKVNSFNLLWLEENNLITKQVYNKEQSGLKWNRVVWSDARMWSGLQWKRTEYWVWDLGGDSEEVIFQLGLQWGNIPATASLVEYFILEAQLWQRPFEEEKQKVQGLFVCVLQHPLNRYKSLKTIFFHAHAGYHAGLLQIITDVLKKFHLLSSVFCFH